MNLTPLRVPLRLCAFARENCLGLRHLIDLDRLLSTDSLGGGSFQPFARDNRAFVPASTNLTAWVSGTDFENKKLTFATGVPCSCCYFCARRCGRGMSDIDSYTNR